jgi:hypothetical protein
LAGAALCTAKNAVLEQNKLPQQLFPHKKNQRTAAAIVISAISQCLRHLQRDEMVAVRKNFIPYQQFFQTFVAKFQANSYLCAPKNKAEKRR